MFYFLIIYSFFAIVRPQDYSVFNFTFPIMRILLFLLIVGLFLLKDKKINYQTDLFLIIFFIIGILSHLAHLYFSGALNFFFTFLPNILIYYIIKNTIKGEQELNIYLKYLILFAFFIVAHSIYQFHNNGIGWSGQIYIEKTKRIRYVGIFSDPNDLALFFNMMLPIIFYYYKSSEKKITKLFNLILIIVFIYAIYLTQSRGALLSLYIMINYYIWKQYGLKQIILINIILVPILFGLKGRLTDIDPEEASAYGRIEAWYEGFQMLKTNPLFGVGPGMFTEYNYLTAHNSFVLALSETGVIGYYFWFGSLYYSFKEIQESYDIQREEINNSLSFYLQISFIGLLISIFFLSRTYVMVLYIFLGLIAANSIACKNSYNVENDIKISNFNINVIELMKIFIFMISSIFLIFIIYKLSL